MSRQHLTGTRYWCSACREEGITEAKFCDTQGDPKKNDFYITGTGRVDNLCKRHRLISNAKYRPPKKGKRLKRIIQKKDHRQTYQEIGRSNLSGINRGTLDGFVRYFNQNQYLFFSTFGIAYSKQSAEKEFRGKEIIV